MQILINENKMNEPLKPRDAKARVSSIPNRRAGNPYNIGSKEWLLKQ